MFPSMTVYPIIDSGGQLRHINFNAFLIIPGTPSTKLDHVPTNNVHNLFQPAVATNF